MRVLILRTPGLDLIHDLKLKGITLPTDCVEGQVRDLPEKAAEALIERHIAEREAGDCPPPRTKDDKKDDKK